MEIKVNDYVRTDTGIIEKLEQEVEEYDFLITMQNNREYRSKFLKEFQKEHGKNVFPDYDEIYKRYDKLKKENKELEINYKEANDSITWWTNRYNAVVKQNDDNHKKVVKLENNRDKAIEVINTQLKNAEGGAKDNLRIIKFNLIKGSCTFEDLKTEEDYKYILKGDSDE